MKHTHCQTFVIDGKDITKFARRHCRKGWVYAFVRYPEGKIILSEVCLVDGVGGYCPASSDVVDKKEFERNKQKDPDFYESDTWEVYRSKIFRDLLFPIKMDCNK